MKKITVVITGGGTGGHIFPGVAIAQEMLARNPEIKVVFIGTERRIDVQAMATYGFDTRAVHCLALKGKGVLARIKALCLLPISLIESVLILRNIHPDIVFGVGGYVTGPVLLAAKILSIPGCIHEQNSIPGMANRKLGAFVNKVFLSLPGSETFFPEEKCVLTGNPLRKEILAIVEAKTLRENPVLLVLGGSQGAHRVNQIVPEALALIKDDLPPGFTVIHQTGVADEEAVCKEYDRLGISAEVAAFFEAMAPVYAKASLVLSRAGATTLAEVTALGLPVILIPFPFAADNHQQKNAEILREKGAAKMFLEKDLTPEQLSVELLSLLVNSKKREEMGRMSETLARPDAAKKIVEECMDMLSE